MGTRSLNFIALKPGIALSADLLWYLNSKRADHTLDERGTLIVYESNFAPMWGRDQHGQNCTFDLEEEIAIQRFLGSLSAHSFYMKRAGEICDYRGAWQDHSFANEPSVQEIEEIYAKATAEVAKPRVLVVVRGGVTDQVADDGVDIEVFDWDNYTVNPKGTGGVPAHFADLAKGFGIPVEAE